MDNKQLTNFMKLEIYSCPENVGLSRVAVAAFAAQRDLTLGQLEEIKVATSEAVSNSIIHGYQNQGNGIICVAASWIDDWLEVVVEDHGQGIVDVQAAMQASYTTDPERMGLGFTFMQSFMDRVEVESRENGGTRVRLLKRAYDLATAVAQN